MDIRHRLIEDDLSVTRGNNGRFQDRYKVLTEGQKIDLQVFDESHSLILACAVG